MEQYLLQRLVGRDPCAGVHIVEYGRLIRVGGIWVGLPAAVRGYLASCYERSLYVGSHLPCRGPGFWCAWAGLHFS